MRWIVVALALVLSACVTGDGVRDLELGMTRDQVIDELGRPDGQRREGRDEALLYTNRLISGWSWDRADYVVLLRDGAVVEYGAGAVRQNRVGGVSTLVLVPIR
jgi:hypothetical protein